MDWRELAGDLIRAGAPIVGGALGGPLGGLVGATAGKIIADALGVEATPDAVGSALKTLPPSEVTAKLQAADADAQAKWPALAQMVAAEAELGKAEVTAIGETMRAELALATLASGPWRNAIAVLQALWRPFAMIVWVATWPFQLVAILHHAYLKDAAALAQLSALLYALAVWNAGPAGLAGVYAWGRTREKLAVVAETAPGVVGQVMRAVKKR